MNIIPFYFSASLQEIIFVHIAQKTKFSVRDFFSKCEQIRSFLDLLVFTKEILNGKLQFLCTGSVYPPYNNSSS